MLMRMEWVYYAWVLKIGERKESREGAMEDKKERVEERAACLVWYGISRDLQVLFILSIVLIIHIVKL